MGVTWHASWLGIDSAALDFVVGGIPRGGTTAFADAFNQHPDIYCHASESHLIEFAAQMAGQFPVSAAALPAVRAELRRCLQINLIDLVEFNLQMGSPDPDLRFDTADLDLLADEMVAALEYGKQGMACADRLAAILARELRRRSGKPLVGEKTPTNALALDLLGWRRTPTNAAPLFVVVRRPFAVIRSMQARLDNPIDMFAADYRGSLAEQAGYYVRHALAVRGWRGQARTFAAMKISAATRTSPSARRFRSSGLPPPIALSTRLRKPSAIAAGTPAELALRRTNRP